MLNMVSGIFIIVMGLSLIGLLRLSLLAGEHRLHLAGRPRGPFGAPLVGAAFAFAWIPCVGPILASILMYAGAVGTVKTGAVLLLVYALELGAPFIRTGLAFTRVVAALRLLRRWSRPIEMSSGAALTVIGVLLLTNKMF